MKKKIKTPTLGVNAKSYIWGDKLLEIARYCDEIAIKEGITVTLNVPFVDIYRISRTVKNVIINAQGVDIVESGSKMGSVLPEALVEAGADGVILNHDSRPMTLNHVVKAINRCKELGLYTFVCTDSLEEAKMIAILHPTGIICEQNELIGSGILASDDYIRDTTEAIKKIDENIIVMQGAGIKSGQDIYSNISKGSESGGGASGIFTSDDPKKVIDDFVEGILKARDDFGSRVY